MQLEYNQNFPIARSGMIADLGPNHIGSRIAEGLIGQGRGVFKIPVLGNPGSVPPGYPGGIWQNPNVSTAADPDAISTSVATVASGAIVGNRLGVAGADESVPPRRITVTLTAHADFDADADGLTVVYLDHLGVQRTEVFAVADGGSETHTTVGYASFPISETLADAAMSGVGGAMTVGYAALDSSVTATDFLGVAVLDACLIEGPYNATPVEDDPQYVSGATVPVLDEGRIWVRTEDACAERGAVYVRIIAGAGGTLVGAFRSDADTATAILVPNAYWERDSGVAGLNILRLV